MQPNFATIGKRLTLRYATGSFSFSSIFAGASDEAVLTLANAFASLQNEPVRQTVSVLTRQLV